MPELPEVESFRKALLASYKGKTIASVKFHRSNLRYPLSPQIKRVLRNGASIVDIRRDGKQLVLCTQFGAINISLGMSGAFLPAIKNVRLPHEHITIKFVDGSLLAYTDPRRFGFWKIHDGNLPHFADPTDEHALQKLFSSLRITTSTRTIKDILMDQSLIGGLGNIYALESLHKAGISPFTRCNAIQKHQYTKLAKAIVQIITQAIEKGGSSIATYRSLHGEKGNFQNVHRIYGRKDQPCLRKSCSGIITQAKQHGRSSWYCPVCQT